MKGLLIKDFRLLRSQMYFLLVMMGCMLVFMMNSSERFGVSYVCAMMALLSLTTVSYDEYENGSAFLFTLPITRKDYVKEKYFFAGILLLTGLVMSMIMWCITAMIKTGNIVWSEWMSYCIGGITAGLLMFAVALPAQLKYGAEKGRIVLITIVVLIVAIGILTKEFTEGTKLAQNIKNILCQIDELGVKGIIGIIGIIVIMWAIVGMISIRISMRMMEKREF